MIIDTSAVIAVLYDEPDSVFFAKTISAAPAPRMSAGNFLEAAIVIDGGRSPIASRRFDDFISLVGIGIEPVTETQARIAREAYRDFGMGSGHKARLNFGDCFAYALAKSTSEPLLFKGNGFRYTDVAVAGK